MAASPVIFSRKRMISSWAGAIVGAGLLFGMFAWACGPASAGAPGLPVLKHLPSFVQEYQRQRVYAMFSDDPAILQGSVALARSRGGR